MELNKNVPNIILNPISDWFDISNIFKNFIFYIGEYMDSAIIFITFLVLYKQYFLFFVYFIGVSICVFLNFILKKIIKQRRPCIDKNLFFIMLQNNEEYVSRNNKKYHVYGMPSGHSQLCGYSSTFIFLFLKNKYYLFLYILISFITLFQRVIYFHHTINQVILGFLIGCLLGGLLFYYFKKYIAGNLKEKEDDNFYL